MAGRGAGRRRCLLLSDFYRLPLSLAAGADLLAYYRRSDFSCGVRILWIASLRLPWLLRRDIFISCRRGRIKAVSGSSGFFGLFFYPDFSAPPLPCLRRL